MKLDGDREETTRVKEKEETIRRQNELASAMKIEGDKEETIRAKEKEETIRRQNELALDISIFV